MTTKNPKVKLLALCGIIILIAIGYGSYMFNKKVPDLGRVKPDFVLSADELYSSFEKDEIQATKTYTDKVIKITGEIESVTYSDSGTNIILKAQNAMMGGVNCSIKEVDASLKTGQTISIKGRCQGFLMAVIINNAQVVL